MAPEHLKLLYTDADGWTNFEVVSINYFKTLVSLKVLTIRSRSRLFDKLVDRQYRCP